MTQQKLNYIHYYLLAIVASVLIWGGFEYISVCNGQNCMIDTPSLWKGVGLIALIFIPITLCIWSEYVNLLLKGLVKLLKRSYEEQILIFGFFILALLFLISYHAFNFYWEKIVDKNISKEYVAALVNVAIFVATIFAPIAALLLYNNWKIQHNLKIFSEDARKIWEDLNDERTLWRQHYHTLDSYPENSTALIECTKFTELFEKSEQEAKNVNRKILKFIRLTNDQNLSNKFNIKIARLIEYQDKYKEKKNLGYRSTNTSFRNIQGIYLSAIAHSIIEIEDYLRDKYILM